MFQCINRLKHNGYKPHAILDIGAYKGLWTEECKKIYSDSQYFLFEPIEYPELKKYNNVFNVILNDSCKEVEWYQGKNTGDSMFRELTTFYKDCIPVKKKSITLEKVLEIELNKHHSFFIKIDAQGAEIPILKGAGKILSKTDFILLEIPFFGQYNENVPNFQKHIEYMNTIDFIPYDIAELHYSHSFLFQIDILFIKNTHPFTKHIKDRLLNDY